MGRILDFYGGDELKAETQRAVNYFDEILEEDTEVSVATSQEEFDELLEPNSSDSCYERLLNELRKRGGGSARGSYMPPFHSSQEGVITFDETADEVTIAEEAWHAADSFDLRKPLESNRMTEALAPLGRYLWLRKNGTAEDCSSQQLVDVSVTGKYRPSPDSPDDKTYLVKEEYRKSFGQEDSGNPVSKVLGSYADRLEEWKYGGREWTAGIIRHMEGLENRDRMSMSEAEEYTSAAYEKITASEDSREALHLLADEVGVVPHPEN